MITAEKTVKTGDVILDMQIPLLTDDELFKLADHAKFLRWSREDDDNDDWADAPLTEDEIAQIEESDRDYENGNYLTLDEFMESQKCEQ